MKKDNLIVNEYKPKRTSKVVLVIAIIIAILSVLLPIGLFSFGMFMFDDGIYTKFNYGITGDVVINNKIEITNVSSIIDQITNNYYIEGYVENISDKKLEFVNIEYSLYDENDILLDRLTSNINDLDKGKKWKFFIEYSGKNSSNVYRYELSKVELY